MNKKSIMQKVVIAISALVIIACSITSISLAWFTDTKSGVTKLKFGKIEIDSENSFATTMWQENELLASMELNDEDVMIDLKDNSNDAVLRAIVEFGVPVMGAVEGGAYNAAGEEVANGGYEIVARARKLDAAPADDLNIVFEACEAKIAAAGITVDAEAQALKLYNAYIGWLETAVDVAVSEDFIARKAYYTENGVENEINYGWVASNLAGDNHFYMVNNATDRTPVAARKDAYTYLDTYVRTQDTAIIANKEYFTEAAGVYTKVEQPAEADLQNYFEREKVAGYVFVDKGELKINDAVDQLTHEAYVPTADIELVEGKEYYALEGEAYVKVETPVLENIATYCEKVVIEYAQYGLALNCMITCEAMQTSVNVTESVFYTVGAADEYASIDAAQGDGDQLLVEAGKLYSAVPTGNALQMTVEVLAAVDKISFAE